MVFSLIFIRMLMLPEFLFYKKSSQMEMMNLQDELIHEAQIKKREASFI